jgi:hypothetical protein
VNPDQYFTGIDDVDVAFARLQRQPPPAGLHVAVMLAVASRARARRRRGYIAMGVARTLAIALSFVLGQQLRLSGALELAGVAISDLDLLLAAPGDFALAIGEGVPWLIATPVLCCVAVLPWAMRLALTPLVRVRGPRLEPEP